MREAAAMAASALRIVPAGAGAGKTHHIQETLLEWVEAGAVRPERILAVTFTEAGASELRQRIRTSLIAKGEMDGALATDRAYISTIHGLGLRLLTEHAFAAGASPAPRLLSDEERDLLIRNELPHATDLHDITADLPRYGYGAPYGTTPEASFRSRVFETVSLLSHLGARGLDPALAEIATATIRATYGPTRGTAATIARKLHKAVEALLAAFPDCIARADMSDEARKTFRKDYQVLCTARDSRRLDKDWGLWSALTVLRQSKRGSVTPDGYDDLALAVMDAASAIETHPGPLADACFHAKALIRGAQQILRNYATRKRELGVIDFTDMVVNAGRLLREDADIRNAVLAEIDCVIVDEFQDTNPSQFALLWPLVQGAPRAIVVGDTKQAIMGFQGANARLMESLVARFTSVVQPLSRNWRSSADIMAFVNAVGTGLFAGRYDALEPKRKAPKGVRALEVVVTEAARRGRAAVRPQQHLAAHLHALLARTDMRISDRASGQIRTPMPGDIAVLCPTNSMCRAYADALASLGVPVRISGPGWWASAVVQAAHHALLLADNPEDRHAALCLATLGPPRVPLEAAITQLLDTGRIEHPIIAQLQGLSETAPTRTVRALLADVISVGGLRDWADMQDDPAQARADLLRFEAETEEFLATHRDMRAAAGFHGFGVKVFLSWLASRHDERDFDQHPNPTGNAADGVEVLTWHASKGREWPLVAVAGLDHDFSPRSGGWQAVCEDYDDLDSLLERTSLAFSPAFHSAAVRARFLDAAAPDAEQTARRLLYVALTRARDVLLLEWPQAAAANLKSDEPCFSGVALLAGGCGMRIETGKLTIGSRRFSARTAFWAKEIPPEFEETPDPERPFLARIGRRAVIPRPPRPDGGPALILPSLLEAGLTDLPARLETVSLGPPLLVASDGFASATDRGTALHDVMRVLLMRPDLAERVAARHGFGAHALEALRAQALGLKAWLEARGYDSFMSEVPVEVQLAGGARISASLDLLARGPAGLAVVDYKSDAVTDCDARFAHHWPQLSAYSAALRASGFADEPILTAICWTGRGRVTCAQA